jgi:uncharacterized protein (TIGR00159 family)
MMLRTMLFQNGCLVINIWQILDFLIVGFLIFQLYRLLRGSVAFNIFVGLVILYLVWLGVDALGMNLLKTFLGQFVAIGVLALVIIFQPEVRRFLLYLGNTTLHQQSLFFKRLFLKNLNKDAEIARQKIIEQIIAASVYMSKKRVGALIVFSKNVNLEGIVSEGVRLNAIISHPLLESIFNKESPLHDGAAIISRNRILAASSVLPVSDRTDLPENTGLRHRAAIGLSEKTNVAVLVISEENGDISWSVNGRMENNISELKLQAYLNEWVGI